MTEDREKHTYFFLIWYEWDITLGTNCSQKYCLELSFSNNTICRGAIAVIKKVKEQILQDILMKKDPHMSS